jgi:hypothetical protein
MAVSIFSGSHFPFLTNFVCNRFFVSQNLKISFSVGWRDYKNITLNFVSVTHNYGIILNTFLEKQFKVQPQFFLRILAICNKMSGSMNGPTDHLRSPALS